MIQPALWIPKVATSLLDMERGRTIVLKLGLCPCRFGTPFLCFGWIYWTILNPHIFHQLARDRAAQSHLAEGWGRPFSLVAMVQMYSNVWNSIFSAWRKSGWNMLNQKSQTALGDSCIVARAIKQEALAAFHCPSGATKFTFGCDLYRLTPSDIDEHDSTALNMTWATYITGYHSNQINWFSLPQTRQDNERKERAETWRSGCHSRISGLLRDSLAIAWSNLEAPLWRVNPEKTVDKSRGFHSQTIQPLLRNCPKYAAALKPRQRSLTALWTSLLRASLHVGNFH